MCSLGALRGRFPSTSERAVQFWVVGAVQFWVEKRAAITAISSHSFQICGAIMFNSCCVCVGAVVDQAADKAERYRCNAADCIRLTQVAPIACRRFLLEMARAWHNLADQVERNDKADLVYEPAQLRVGTQQVKQQPDQSC